MSKQKKQQCRLSANLATNLRLRQDDAIKVVPLAAADHSVPRSGDLVLMQAETVPKTASVTFSPVEDSLDAVQASEGGDEIADEELMERFIKPYAADTSAAMVKAGSILTLQDDNGKKLDFIVTHVDLEGAAPKEEEQSGTCALLVHQKTVYIHVSHSLL